MIDHLSMATARPSSKRQLPEERRSQLKALLAQGKSLRAMECHNPLSAVVAAMARSEAEGEPRMFDLLWVSGFSNATAHALPDAELLWLDQRLAMLSAIAAVSRKPILVDVDTGGEALALSYLCTRLEELGVSGFVVEDKAGAKRTSLAEEVQHTLEDPIVFVEKLAVARRSMVSQEVLIFARIESLIAGAGLDDALARAELYLRSVADGIVIHSKDQSGKEVFEFMEGYRNLVRRADTPKPLVCIPTAYNEVTANELFARGASIVIYGNHMIRAAYKAMRSAAESILAHDRSLEADRDCASVKELLFLIESMAPVQAGETARSPGLTK